MAEKVLILGESGTGKSTSMRNVTPDKVAVVNPVGKPLPFKNKFDTLDGETDARKIIKYMKEQVAAGKKMIVIDDFQYILAVPYMHRIKETGWGKYNDFGSNYFDLIDVCNELPADVIIYYMSHIETLENGLTTIKLIGKLLREKITIEGLFTTVLRTNVTDGNYYFLTQNSGKDTVKSPLGMFPTYAIDNDLNYVDEKIRNYYEIGEFLTDAEVAEIDELAKKVEIEKPADKKRRGRASRTEEPAAEEKPARRTRTREEVQEANTKAVVEAGADDEREQVPFEEMEQPETEKLPRRTRKTKEQPEAEQPEEEEKPARRTRKDRSAETPEQEAPAAETADAAPARRRRRV